MAEEDPNSPEKIAFRAGFLKGFYDEWPMYPHELDAINPYPKNTSEHDEFIKGYYSNLD